MIFQKYIRKKNLINCKKRLKITRFGKTYVKKQLLQSLTEIILKKFLVITCFVNNLS